MDAAKAKELKKYTRELLRDHETLSRNLAAAEALAAERQAELDKLQAQAVANQTQVSAVVLETEQPTFEEFFLFGCQAIGSTVALTCYDWDPDYLVWNEDELVFRASTFRWPDRGVVERWYDATDAQYWVDVDFSYDVPAPSGAPTTAAPSLPPTTARPTAADAEHEDEAEGEYPDEAEADGGDGDDDASDAGATCLLYTSPSPRDS